MLAIVTGASRGLGFEIACEFSKNSKILVLAVTRNPSSLQKFISKTGATNLLPVKADLSRSGEIAKISRLVQRLGLPVDLLIHNAATLLKKPFGAFRLKDLEETYHTNVFIPLLLSQALLPYMNSKNRSHIVHIGSMGGVQGSAKFPGLTVYSSSKAALAGISECMAEELRQRNIAVNCLALGSVQTEMLAQAFPGYKAPISASRMAEFICGFAQNGHEYFNGKIIPVSSTTP